MMVEGCSQYRSHGEFHRPFNSVAPQKMIRGFSLVQRVYCIRLPGADVGNTEVDEHELALSLRRQRSLPDRGRSWLNARHDELKLAVTH